MKVGILVILLIVGVSFAFTTDASSDPSWSEDQYVEKGRFETVKMTGVIDSVVTDTKTGCQYMVIFQSSIAALGCFDEYKKPKAK